MGILGTISSKNSSNGFLTGVGATFEAVRGTTVAGLSNWVAVAGSSAYQIGRIYHIFDTTSIPIGAKINAVTLVHPLVSNLTNTSGGYTVVTTHTGTDPIGSTDFGNIQVNGGTSYGSIALSVLGTAVGTLGITLDANGIANLQAGGTTRYALRINADLIDSEPGTNILQYTSSIASYQIIVDYNPVAVLTTHSKFWGGA